MPVDPDLALVLDRLEGAIRCAAKPQRDFFSALVASCCTRAARRGTRGLTPIDRLIAVEAWTEATLASVELGLPAWTPRRLMFEDGAWLCSLSRRPYLPANLDHCADGAHESLPLAILLAILEARGRTVGVTNTYLTVPEIRPAPPEFVCCDNFS